MTTVFGLIKIPFADIGARLTALETQGNAIMATLQDLKADLDAIKTGVETLKAKLTAALANVTIPPDVQAEIDAAFQEAEAVKASVA